MGQVSYSGWLLCPLSMFLLPSHLLKEICFQMLGEILLYIWFNVKLISSYLYQWNHFEQYHLLFPLASFINHFMIGIFLHMSGFCSILQNQKYIFKSDGILKQFLHVFSVNWWWFPIKCLKAGTVYSEIWSSKSQFLFLESEHFMLVTTSNIANTQQN